MFSYAFFSLVVMETHCEQRTVIKFCFKNESTATETFKMLQKVYGNECLSCTNVFKWYGKFRNGRESVDDDPRVGHRQTSLTSEYIAKVCAASADDRRSMIRALVKWFHIDKETVHKIITKYLGGKKLSVRIVPYVLTSEQREDRITSCCDFLQMHENYPEFFNKIITGDESWFFGFSLMI